MQPPQPVRQGFAAGADALGDLLPPGTTAVFLGPSGAGKSTLINHLLGEDRLETAVVRNGDHKGRHTTTRRQLVSLSSILNLT